MAPATITSDPEILGGMPCFAGTRVPLAWEEAKESLLARVA